MRRLTGAFELAEGARFGAYRIDGVLGAGAMGAVYNATHTGLEKPVVVKVLRPEWASNVDVRARFVREGRAAAAIRHPHVVDVTDVGELDGTPYLVMERLVGETLTAFIARGPGMPPELAVDVLLPVCAAVDAAHAAGVVHRDLKPDNLFVTRTPSGEVHPKVLDFGISRVTGDGGQTGTTATLGTPAYMAPEQIVSSRDANALSDQYALGVILYECLTGRQAFKAENIYVVLRMVGDGVFTPPRALQPALSPELEAVVLRAMARDPGQRFPSLKAFAAALLPWASMRARGSWAPLFAAYAQHGAATGAPLPDLSSTMPAGGPPQPLFAPPDTLNRAALEKLDTTTAVGARGGARFVVVAALAAVLLAAAGFGGTAWVLRERRSVPAASPSSPLPSPTPVVASPFAAAASPVAAVAVPVAAAPAVAAPPVAPVVAAVADAGVARARGGVGRRSRRAAGAVGAAPMGAPLSFPSSPAAPSAADDLPP